MVEIIDITKCDFFFWGNPLFKIRLPIVNINSSDLIDAKLEEHQMCGSKQCPGGRHKLETKPMGITSSYSSLQLQDSHRKNKETIHPTLLVFFWTKTIFETTFFLHFCFHFYLILIFGWGLQDWLSLPAGVKLNPLSSCIFIFIFTQFWFSDGVCRTG